MPWADKVKAIIVQFLPGQASGDGLASILFGDVNPSARLPLSFPRTEDQSWLQTYEQYPGVHQGGKYIVHYTEDLLIGYRWFDALRQEPLFEFGAGLSYTTFAYSDAVGSQQEVLCTVRNTGSVAGHEVLQLYLSFQEEPEQPPKVLRGFQRVFLEAGESKQVSFPLTPADLKVWDVVGGHWRQAGGDIGFVIGASSRDIRLKGTLSVTKATLAV